jgi:transposase
MKSLRKTSILMMVSHMTISRWLVSPNQKVYNNSNRLALSKTLKVIESIKCAITATPLITSQELKSMLKNALQIHVSSQLVRSIIYSIGMTRKKVRFYGRPKDLKVKTDIYKAKRDEFIENGKVFYSLDETSFGRHGRQVYGYSMKGTQIHVPKNQPRTTTQSMLALVSSFDIVKTTIKNGSFNSISFFEFLVSASIPFGSVILLDNVSFHYCKAVKELAINRGWELLFVPPYSPWFNPIEGIFSIIKRSYYKQLSITESIGKVTKQHLASFFQHSLQHKGFCN